MEGWGHLLMGGCEEDTPRHQINNLDRNESFTGGVLALSNYEGKVGVHVLEEDTSIVHDSASTMHLLIHCPCLHVDNLCSWALKRPDGHQ